MPVENLSGVYLITNQHTGKNYVGSACNLRKRWNQHRSALRKGVHDNLHLQRSADKHGLDAFTFEVLCVCLPKDLIYFEQKCIDWFKPEYNMRTLASSMLGYKHTPQARFNMSKAHLGKPNGWLGKAHSEDTRRLMCLVNKLKGNGLTGTSKPGDTKIKIAAALRGNTNASGKRSEEAKRRISEGRLRAKRAREGQYE